MRPTALAHLLLHRVLREGDHAIDATAGNGHDTLFLAGAVGASGRVQAYDIQPAAIAGTRERLRSAGMLDRVELREETHRHLASHAAPGSVAAVMFNLGYLPGQDHETITHAGETLAALDAAATVLRPGGSLSVVCYPGHPGGEDEAAAVENWMLARAAEGWQVTRHGAIGTRRPAPFLLLAVTPRPASPRSPDPRAAPRR